MPVENGVIGKLVRTSGFLLLLFSTILISFQYFITLTILTDYVNIVETFVNEHLIELIEFSYFFLVIGALLLLWTQSNSYIFRLVVTLTTLGGTFIHYNINVVNYPEFLEFLKVEDLFDEIVWLPYVGVVSSVLMFYLLIGFKKPKKLSTNLLSTSLIIMLLAVTFNYVPDLLGVDSSLVAIKNSYIFIYLLSYAVASIGSAFGLLGFMRK